MTRCHLKYPIECWKYSSAEKTIPIWALPWVQADDKNNLEYKRPDSGSGDEAEMLPGHWLVRLDDDTVLLYEDIAFNKVFKVCPDVAVAP